MFLPTKSRESVVSGCFSSSAFEVYTTSGFLKAWFLFLSHLGSFGNSTFPTTLGHIGVVISHMFFSGLAALVFQVYFFISSSKEVFRVVMIVSS
jgi:hypothetical protein